jgi:hypothetical protein
MNQKSKSKETIGQRRGNHYKEIAKPKRGAPLFGVAIYKEEGLINQKSKQKRWR